MSQQDQSSGVNDGVILTTTRWNQSGKIYFYVDGKYVILDDVTYNQYCPLLPNSTTTHCVTGCTNTADSQILYYWLSKGYDLNLKVTTDNYYVLSGSSQYIYVSDNPTHGEGSLSEINAILANDTLETSLTDGNFIAALNFFCGVNNHSEYGSSTLTSWMAGTSYTGTNAASFKAAGFDSDFTIAFVNKTYFDGYVLTDLGFSIVRENLDYGEIISLSIPGHAIYLDGYRYNETTGEYEYHLNYGWGVYTSATDWYTVDELEEIEMMRITIDLSPDINVNVTNTRSDYYGGSILRGVERINHIRNEKTAEFAFDESIVGETISQTNTLNFTNTGVNLIFKDFSINYDSTASIGIKSVANMDFEIENGSIVVNNSVADSAISGVQVSIDLDNSWIYTGYWSAGFDDIRNEMDTDADYNIADFNSDFLVSVSGNAVEAGADSDIISLSNNSAIFGNLALGQGNNAVTIETGSLLCGGFSGTADNCLELNFKINNTCRNAMIAIDSAEAAQSLFDVTEGELNIVFAKEDLTGTYTLVDGSDSDQYNNFTANITVNGTVIGTVSADGSSLKYNGLYYTLQSYKGNLAINVSSDGSAGVLYPAKIYENGILKKEGTLLAGETLASGNSMLIFSGGTANSTTVNSGGWMLISSGGTANCTTVNSSGHMNIYAGGLANSTTVNSYGSMNIFSGVANNTTVNSYGSMNIYCGGTANSTTVNSRGKMYIHSGGVANSTTVNSIGYMLIFNDGVANSTTVNSWGSMFISSGGVANSTTVNSDGYMWVNSGGTANSTTINRGYMSISSGGIANSTTVNSSGKMHINSGGTANSTTVNSYGSMNIYAGGVANSTTVADGYMYVYSGGVANSTTFTDGYMYVYSGGTANSTTVADGYMYVYSGGMANNTIVSSGGVVVIRSGGMTNNSYAFMGVNVLLGGSLYVSSGGTALIAENGGYVKIEDGATVSFASTGIYNRMLSNCMTVHSNTRAIHNTVNSGGEIHVYSGGVADSNTVNSGGEIHVYSGGGASSNTVSSRGKIYVSDGAAHCNTVNFGGEIHVYSGGEASSNTVNSGYMHIYSGGVASNTWISAGGVTVDSAGIADESFVDTEGIIYVESGGVANSTHVLSGGRINISSGGIANNTENTGSMNISSGGIANDTKGGNILIYSGGVANNTVRGNIQISSGGVANNTEGGNIQIFSGGVANSTILADHSVGSMTIFDGGVANNTTMKGSIHQMIIISSGGLANNTIMSSRTARMYVSSGGTANNTVISFDSYGWGGSLCVIGGTANNTTINYGGSAFIFARGVANETINSGLLTLSAYGTANDTENYGYMNIVGIANDTENYGSMNISSGGSANRTIVHSGGSMSVSSGGIATEIKENGGYVEVEDGATVTFASNTIDGLILSSVDDSYINRRSMSIHSNTVANHTILERNYVMDIFSGGIANNTTLNFWCSMNISSGGVANSTTVNSGGKMYISSGGVANSTTVNSNGFMYISSGGTAKMIKENGGYVDVADGANVTFASNTISGLNLSGDMTVHSNTVANSTTVNDHGRMYISSGGVANSTTINSGCYMYISSGGTANSTTVVNSNGAMCIYSGGTANSTTVNSGGYMYITSGGVANSTTVSFNGRMDINSGGTANSTTVNSGGSIRLYSGGIANSTTVNSRGNMYISSGGVANSTTVNSVGFMYISSGGVANSTTVNSGGYIRISSGGTHSGGLQLSSGAVVEAYSGSVIDFTVKGRTSNDGFLINDLSLITGDPSYTLTVSADQTFGQYKLAAGAEGFDQTITVKVDNQTVGTITVGGNLNVNGNSYTLTLTDESLYLNVSKTDNIPPAKPSAYANITSATNQSVTVSATFSSDTATKQYSLDNRTWNTYTSGVLVSSNCSVYFRGKDAAGNISEVTTYTVSNIDKVLPTIGSVSITQGANNYTFTATASASDNKTASGNLKYKIRYASSSSGLASATVYSGKSFSLTSAAAGKSYYYQVGVTDEAGNTVWSPAKSVTVKTINTSNTASNVQIYSSGVLTSKLSTVTGAELIYGKNNSMYIHSGGVANSTTVGYGGRIYITSGGTANNTSVYDSDGYAGMTISSGGVANGTTVDYDSLVISSGGVANSTTVEYGNMFVSSGGTANNTKVFFSYMYISSGSANYTTLTGNGYAYNRRGVMSGVTVSFGGKLYVSNGGVTDTVYVSSGANAYVWSGGILKNAFTQSFGCLYVYDGGIASSTNLMTNGNLYIYSGGKAFDTVTSYGVKIHMSGGTMTNLNMKRGTITSAYQGAIVSKAIVDYGSYLMVDSGATTYDTVVSSGGGLTVMSGAVAEDNVIYGTLNCNNGGILLGETTIHSRANLAGNAVVTDETSITFDVSERSASAMQESYQEAMLNSYYVAREADMTISVSADQASGSYILANWALEAKKGTFTLKVDGTEVGTFSTSESLTYDGKTYSLYCFDDSTNSKALTLKVCDATSTDAWTDLGSGDFDGDGIEESLVSDGTNLYAASEDLWLGNLSGTEEIASIADYNNDGTDDLLIHNTATDQMTAWLVKDGTTYSTLAIA